MRNGQDSFGSCIGMVGSQDSVLSFSASETDSTFVTSIASPALFPAAALKNTFVALAATAAPFISFLALACFAAASTVAFLDTTSFAAPLMSAKFESSIHRMRRRKSAKSMTLAGSSSHSPTAPLPNIVSIWPRIALRCSRSYLNPREHSRALISRRLIHAALAVPEPNSNSAAMAAADVDLDPCSGPNPSPAGPADLGGGALLAQVKNTSRNSSTSALEKRESSSAFCSFSADVPSPRRRYARSRWTKAQNVTALLPGSPMSSGAVPTFRAASLAASSKSKMSFRASKVSTGTPTLESNQSNSPSPSTGTPLVCCFRC
mmetsp:Transcript_71631/g.128984  ORF Transcript_71631/g.128984 Transcript_71631/m.128984 type:complete len:319 (+) Transcript_71631:463-1419(+)